MRRGWTTVRLSSGLGNQLFQYAAGRAVAERTRTKLRFDISFFGTEPNRTYALGDFLIRARVVDGPSHATGAAVRRGLETAYARQRFQAEVVHERRNGYDAEVLAAPSPNSFLSGYWQSERYFADHAELIRRELRPRVGRRVSAQAAEIAASPCSIAVHVRRGDLVEDARMREIFGLTDPAYFGRAVARLLDSNPAARCFVFSDDPEWCRDELELPAPKHVVSGDNAPFEDLALMAACDHAVITASTFAWWGAWLGERPGTTVIAPRDAFTGTKPEPPDCFPERWLRV